MNIKMHFKFLFLLTQLLLLTSCQMGYIIENAYHQARILKRAVPVEHVLKDESINADIKKKLILAEEAKVFAEQVLHLKKTKNYSTFVQLDGPYVTYVVSAAPKNELAYYTWSFPIIGSVPYKGYFTKSKAENLAHELQEQNYDTYVRGVSAFSTLGWFKDPILSSMTAYADYDLVNTIIHETVHATLYISSNANFNERLASYLGDLGTKMFYEQKHQNELHILNDVKKDLQDQKLFGEFISSEIKQLEQWYKTHKADPQIEQLRESQFQLMRNHFEEQVKPKLVTGKYLAFAKSPLNNARLMGFKLYMNDMQDFESLTVIFKADFEKILNYCKSLEKEKDPESALKTFVAK